MIGHRIVADLRRADRPDSPAGKELVAQKLVRDRLRPLRRGDAGEQHLAGVGGPHLALPLAAVQRQRIGADLLAPERLLECGLQRIGLQVERRRKLPTAEGRGHFRGMALRRVDIALNLAQRDRSLRIGAVGMKHGIDGVLPALIDEAAPALARILDEAVAVAVAALVHPAEGRLDARPEPADGPEVTGPLQIHSGEDHEQRRAVYRTVVEGEGNLAQPGHLSGAHLV